MMALKLNCFKTSAAGSEINEQIFSVGMGLGKSEGCG